MMSKKLKGSNDQDPNEDNQKLASNVTVKTKEITVKEARIQKLKADTQDMDNVLSKLEYPGIYESGREKITIPGTIFLIIRELKYYYKLTKIEEMFNLTKTQQKGIKDYLKKSKDSLKSEEELDMMLKKESENWIFLDSKEGNRPLYDKFEEMELKLEEASIFVENLKQKFLKLKEKFELLFLGKEDILLRYKTALDEISSYRRMLQLLSDSQDLKVERSNLLEKLSHVDKKEMNISQDLSSLIDNKSDVESIKKSFEETTTDIQKNMKSQLILFKDIESTYIELKEEQKKNSFKLMFVENYEIYHEFCLKLQAAQKYFENALASMEECSSLIENICADRKEKKEMFLKSIKDSSTEKELETRLDEKSSVESILNLELNFQDKEVKQGFLEIVSFKVKISELKAECVQDVDHQMKLLGSRQKVYRGQSVWYEFDSRDSATEAIKILKNMEVKTSTNVIMEEISFF